MKTTVLPDATRDEMLKAAGLDSSAHWPEVDRVTLDASEEDFLVEGGWHAVDIKNSEDEAGGLTSHRGVLHPDEYVDEDALRPMVEVALGFTYEEVSSVYRQGPLSPTQRQLRDKIDARLLALSLSGGSMIELARILGWTIKEATGNGGASCDTMERALARARSAS